MNRGASRLDVATSSDLPERGLAGPARSRRAGEALGLLSWAAYTDLIAPPESSPLPYGWPAP
jgi:hypothetical protein